MQLLPLPACQPDMPRYQRPRVSPCSCPSMPPLLRFGAHDGGESHRRLADQWKARFRRGEAALARHFSRPSSSPAMARQHSSPATATAAPSWPPSGQQGGDVLRQAAGGADPYVCCLKIGRALQLALSKKWLNDDQRPSLRLLPPVGPHHGDERLHRPRHHSRARTHPRPASPPDFPAVRKLVQRRPGQHSIHEQCSLGPNTITGHENWRLPCPAERDKRGQSSASFKELAHEDPVSTASRHAA